MANLINLPESGDDSSGKNEFPIHIFPKDLQEIMNEYHKVLNFNYDYMGLTILVAISLAMGSFYKLQVKKKWIEFGVLWGALVGKAGINKSAPLSVFLEPFREFDKLNYEKYKIELYEYNIQIFKKKGKPKNTEDHELNSNDVMPIALSQPKRKQFLISDFTPEALSVAHEDNPGGITIYSDELLTWINNFGRYSKSGEEQFYLSIWSSKDININRRNSPHIYISNPFINVIGTIQPEKLVDTFGKGRDSSGFTHRILFAFPDSIIREDLSDLDVPDIYIKAYQNLIEGLLTKRTSKFGKSGIESTILEFDKAGYEKFKEWRNKNNQRINKGTNDDLGGIYSKLEIYLLRFALLLQVIEDECNKKDCTQIQLKAVESAIDLIKYFEITAIKVSKLISKYNDPLANYAMDKRIVYTALPTEFSTCKGKEIATKFNMPERTFFDFLNDDYLFEKQRHGYYFKKV